MSQEPYKLLTLVIPTYNMEKYLTQSLPMNGILNA